MLEGSQYVKIERIYTEKELNQIRKEGYKKLYNEVYCPIELLICQHLTYDNESNRMVVSSIGQAFLGETYTIRYLTEYFRVLGIEGEEKYCKKVFRTLKKRLNDVLIRCNKNRFVEILENRNGYNVTIDATDKRIICYNNGEMFFVTIPPKGCSFNF